MQTTDDEGLEIEREERAIYAIVIAAMLPVIVGLAIEGGEIDGGAALSVLLVSLGLVGLVASLRAVLAPKVPRARARYSRSS